jgi:hypothetical protein
MNPVAEQMWNAKGRPATGRPFVQGRIVPTEVQETIRTFLEKILWAAESYCQEVFKE